MNEASSIQLAGGREVGYHEYGPATGRPILYCHGLPGSRLEPALLRDAAERNGLRLIGIDRPGYGASSAMPGRRVGDEIADVRTLVDHLGLLHFDVLGFSGGGPHAMSAATALPERVDRMTLVSSWSPFDAVGLDGMIEGFQQLWELARADFASFRSTLAQAVEAAGSPYALLYNGAPDTDRQILSRPPIRDRYDENLDEAVRPGLEGMFEDSGAQIAEWSFRVDAIGCPVNVWHGEHDGNAPVSMGRWLARQLPRSRYTEWTGATHFEFFRRFDEVLAAHAIH